VNVPHNFNSQKEAQIINKNTCIENIQIIKHLDIDINLSSEDTLTPSGAKT